jgi:hypothetical protein
MHAEKNIIDLDCSSSSSNESDNKLSYFSDKKQSSPKRVEKLNSPGLDLNDT